MRLLAIWRRAMSETEQSISEFIKTYYYSAKEASYELGIHEESLRRLCRQKKLKCEKHRGKYYFRKSHLDNFSVHYIPEPGNRSGIDGHYADKYQPLIDLANKHGEITSGNAASELEVNIATARSRLERLVSIGHMKRKNKGRVVLYRVSMPKPGDDK